MKEGKKFYDSSPRRLEAVLKPNRSRLHIKQSVSKFTSCDNYFAQLLCIHFLLNSMSEKIILRVPKYICLLNNTSSFFLKLILLP